ncbi:hypothetical protein METBIDRAFT_78284 [Metschnikowia bicuspidata var. bicuspidata NRRL YB-4993]|uniref:DNA-directed DNA polymerase n=1 Tax=Metschnikowia bicuspidata var. bicuspidata NRRL YB-4993 TaxID=869754 RepID=A0A1A0HB73_9ASCO|nr:hypothetical protein METBIDRAFT_78284 [Metschnikowia bicuspidata var. bicuspidata NRRL YB-4993]OBA21261.1 hypothetical protein METBIDRAFT_78284 [Metschnikowia bicuspidata var. bicuspidata NRRL YB-4993]
MDEASTYAQKPGPRVNQVGIQYLSKDLHKKVFPNHSPEEFANPPNPALLELAREHLKQSNLLGKKTQITEPINIPNFPDLVGKNTLDEHFFKIGSRYSEPYLSMARNFFAEDRKLPDMPTTWLFESGWTRYAPGAAPENVPVPLEDELVFDVEVLYKKTNYAVIATAVSPQAWYGWVSPIMTSYREGGTDWDHLIPFETHKRPKLLVGYNVSYDRARVKEEYSVKRSKAFFMDAMAFHIATSGFCSQQRPLYHKHKKNKKAAEAEPLEEDSENELLDPEFDADESAKEVAQGLIDDPWLNKGSPNSLANAAEFHCGITMDKAARDFFSSTDLNEIIDNFQYLMKYCAQDVDATYQVTQKVFPEFCRRNPHPVSFAALRLMGSLFLPTTKKWENYIESAEKIYQENREQVSKILLERVGELIRYIEEGDESLKPDFEKDPWLKQMNWNLKLPRMKKDGTPVANQAFMTGYPEWYRDLFKTVKSETGESSKQLNLTVRTRITPLLLRLKWEGYPLIWTDSAGWCFKVPNKEEIVEEILAKNYHIAKLSDEDQERMIPELRDDGNYFELFKIPHPAGPKSRCTLIMSKSYLRYFESGVLTSEYEHAANILSLNATASYWMGNRSRITEQFVVYADKAGKKNKFFNTVKETAEHENMGMILPKLCTMGTVTRRATENTWLTASNSKKNRIGSELKALVEAPKGYVFVGADVDSEELWIASLIGDALFKVHGGTALGWMTLEGDKNEKTDLHSKTAEIMGILRGDAKIFNYGRIYGAGVKFATQLLKQCNALIDDESAVKIAQELYERTKGQTAHSKVFGRRVYHGGTESVMFNALESIAYLESPKTPVLGCSITDALTQKNLNKNNYLTSRINWTIQSSGVDYLHLLIVSMEYLIEKFKIDARLMITVHDELRYMVREDQKLVTVVLLQISNLWTRAMFCQQMGINELPQSCAFFSEVDIDFVLRKEVGLECITPSHPESIPPGESYSFHKLMQTCDVGEILGRSVGTLEAFKSPKYESRMSLILTLDGDQDDISRAGKLCLQNSVSKEEWTRNMNLHMKHQRLILNAFAGNVVAPSGSHTNPDTDVQGSGVLSVAKPKRIKKLRKGIVEDVSLTKKIDDENLEDHDGGISVHEVKPEVHDSTLMRAVNGSGSRRARTPEDKVDEPKRTETFIRTDWRNKSRVSSEFNQRRSWSTFPQPWSRKKLVALSYNQNFGFTPESLKSWRPESYPATRKLPLVPVQLKQRRFNLNVSDQLQETPAGIEPSDDNFKRRKQATKPAFTEAFARSR